MAPPTISVVIPTYNRASLLTQAIDSALAQTWTDREILVVDDGSTDATAEVVGRYGPAVRHFRKENGGEASARNLGLREARGTWVAFLDSDDAWDPRALATLMKAAAAQPSAGVIAMRGRGMLADGTLTQKIHGKNSAGLFFTTRSLLWGDSGGVLMPMVRRDLALAAGGFDESILSATDCDMWLRLSFLTTIIGVPEALLKIRLHPQNLSGDKSLNARMWLKILGKLEAEHPEWVAENRWTFRRALGKERMRLGREILAAWDGTPADLAEARRALGTSITAFPFILRSWLYMGWCLFAPRGYAVWRRFETRSR